MILALIISTIIVIVVYSIYLAKKSPQQGWNWSTTLIATFVSLLLAISVGIMLFQYRQNQKNENNRTRYLKLLQSELSDTKRTLSNPNRMDIIIKDKKYEAFITYIQPIITEDAIRSGLFSELISENLLNLARKINLFNVKTQFLMTILSSFEASDMGFTNLIPTAINNIENSRKAILQAINLISKQLNIKLTPLEKYKDLKIKK